MAGKKTIRHRGTTMSEEEHRRWHEQHEGKDLTGEEHEELLKHMGISRAEDRKWHEAQNAVANKPDEPAPEERSVNCFAIGGGFLDYCVRQGWLIRQRHGKATKYYVTEAGRKALADFGITKY